MKIWKIRAGSSGAYWNSWDARNIVTIGWDVGDLKSISREETKEKIQEEYDELDPGGVTGRIRTFAGVRDDAEYNMEKGDIAVVLGDATVLGIAIVGKYEYVPDGIEENETHTYHRDAEYLFKGPVRIRDLPDRFKQGGNYPLHLVPTLTHFSNANEETIEELLKELKDTEVIDTSINPFIDFSEGSLQSYIEKNYKEVSEDILTIEREHQTSVGNADFKCEIENNEILIIETKIGTANDCSVGQLLGYMSAIKSENQNKRVKGMIIAEDFTERVKKAVESEDIQLKKFRAKLEFQEL